MSMNVPGRETAESCDRQPLAGNLAQPREEPLEIQNWGDGEQWLWLEPASLVTVFPSQLGWIAVRWRGTLLAQLSFGHEAPTDALQAVLPGSADACQRQPADTVSDERQELVRRLRRYAETFSGGDFRDVAIDEDGLTGFQRHVIARCRSIPCGETRTYGEIGRQVGSPQAARAVGRVMAQNRVPLVVPCHRVVGASGQLVGFSAPQGVTMKQRLLAGERGRAS
jgi:O-6-methylguanine DNA methyltransferase